MTLKLRKINKPAVKLSVLGRIGASEPGKASNNGVRSCHCDLLNEVPAKLGGNGEIRYFVHI